LWSFSCRQRCSPLSSGSLFTPLVFDTGRFALGEAWGLTKGRVWPLFGAYVLTFVFVIVIYLLFLVIMSAVAAVVGGGLGGVAQIFNPDLSSLAAYFTPVLLVSTLVGSLLSALLTALGAGVVASAYGQIAARKDVDVFA
jgi:ABC-type cobalt transport system substrate-binding protein